MTIRAPFTGSVVSGDLSKRLVPARGGGCVVIRSLRLNEYRVYTLRVAEARYSRTSPGNQRALGPERACRLRPYRVPVQRITPISSPAERREMSLFDVEAIHRRGPDLLALRPGMEGVPDRGRRAQTGGNMDRAVSGALGVMNLLVLEGLVVPFGRLAFLRRVWYRGQGTLKATATAGM